MQAYVFHYNNVRLLGAARKTPKDHRRQAAEGAETPGHWSLLMMIGEFRPVEGRGSPNFLFADDPLGVLAGSLNDMRYTST